MIDKPAPGVVTDTSSHPAGAPGAKKSLQEVADRAWKARMSPRLRAWVTQVLDKAGVSRGGRREKARAILEAFRKKVPYIADPLMGEFMSTPDQLLCLDENGLCIIGGDCDEASITLAAAMLCIAIPAMIIGSSHRPPADVPTHVSMAFQDELEDWIRMDGTTNHPVGQVGPRLREWWVEPGKEAKEQGVGDFVGMSDGSLGAPSSASVADLIYPGIR
jgi:hypothetical protein